MSSKFVNILPKLSKKGAPLYTHIGPGLMKRINEWMIISNCFGTIFKTLTGSDYEPIRSFSPR